MRFSFRLKAFLLLCLAAALFFLFVFLSRELKTQSREEPSFENVQPTLSTTHLLIAPVERQLRAFHQLDIFGAYKGLVSKKFQERMPFDKFKLFVIQNAILTHFTSFDFKEHFLDGNQGVVTVILNSDSEPIPVKYLLIQEGNEWKIDALKIVRSNENREESQPDASMMIAEIESILKELKQNEYEKVYRDFLAEHVRKTTTLEDFIKFIKNYPAFSSYQSLNIKEPFVDENSGHLVVDLVTAEGTTSVKFNLKTYDREWKVEGINATLVPQLPEQVTTSPEGKNFKTRELLAVIQSFLKMLHTHEEEKAYRLYTSQNFQSSNSFSQFQKFLTIHPELISSSSTTFEKLMFNNDIATFTGKLFVSESHFLPVEFDLLFEEGKWKILNVFTYPLMTVSNKNSEELPLSLSLEIEKILIGTSVNEKGDIEDPKTTFSSPVGDFYVTLFINHGIVGTKLEVVLRHVHSGSEISPIQATLRKNGDNELSFVFSPPPKGWPVGSYQIRVSSSTKIFKTFGFTVNKSMRSP